MFFGGFPGQGEDPQPEENKKEVNTTEFYQLLEVTKDATTEQIKKAYRKKALKEHPDRGGDPERFHRIKQACDALSDPQKRQLYDEYGEEGVKNGGPPGMSGNMFDFFNPQKKDNRPKKMKPKLVEVQVTLEQVYSGTMKEVTVTRYRVCVDCEGKGGKNPVKCEKCKGNGVVIKMVQLGPGIMTQAQSKCDACDGQGETMKEEDKCKTCDGKRVKQQQKTLQVPIDRGVPDSHDYIFYGQSDELPGIMAGDVYARIMIKKHDVFERRGADLLFIKEITLLEALTGVTTKITHLDGKEYTVATAPNEVLENKEPKTIKRLGMPFYKDAMSHGNLYFQFLVTFPPPRSIKNDAEKALRHAFGYKSTNKGLDKKPNCAVFDDFSEEMLNPRATRGHEQDEEEEGGQQGGIQCQGQ